MKYPLQRHTVLLLSVLACGLSVNANAASAALRKAEAGQLMPDNSPMAQYNRSKREARAAYTESLKFCRELPRAEREPCRKDAQNSLQDDLAYAKQLYNRARQLTPIPGPQAQYRNARREAYAAFEEATRNCKAMDPQRKSDCMRSARAHLQSDLAYARNELTPTTSSGTSGAGTSGTSR